MTIVQLLSADEVTTEILLVGVPACIFVIGYSATVWWMAVQLGNRLRTSLYLLAASGGLAVHLCWPSLASYIADSVAVAASPGDQFSTLNDTYAKVAVL